MTSEVFLDTAFVIALSVATDEHHKRAEELADQLETEAIHLVTSPFCWKLAMRSRSNVIAKPLSNY